MNDVSISDIPNLVRIAYAANVPVLLEGRHGIGKSSAIERAAQDMGIRVCVLDLSLLEPVDLLGLPKLVNDSTIYVAPSILPRDGKGLLLLEELNRASPQTRSPALELLTRRQLHEYRLPEGWLPCASINPEGSDYIVDSLDPALRSRFMTIPVAADIEGWLRWAEQAGVHRIVREYAASSPDLFTHSDVDPRSLEYASSVLKSHESEGQLDVHLLVAALSGIIGERVAVAMLRFARNSEVPPSADEITSAYSTVRASIRRAVRQSRLDFVRSAVATLMRSLQRQRSWDELRADPSRMSNLALFLDDIPPDMRTDFESWKLERGYC